MMGKCNYKFSKGNDPRREGEENLPLIFNRKNCSFLFVFIISEYSSLSNLYYSHFHIAIIVGAARTPSIGPQPHSGLHMECCQLWTPLPLVGRLFAWLLKCFLLKNESELSAKELISRSSLQPMRDQKLREDTPVSLPWRGELWNS